VSNNGVDWKLISKQLFSTITWFAELSRYAATDGARIYVSSDLITWAAIQGPTLPVPPTPGSTTIIGVAYGKGMWVAAVNIVGRFRPDGYVVFAAQGPNPPSSSSWTIPLSSGGRSSLSGITYGNGVFLLTSGNFMQFSANGTGWATVQYPPDLTEPPRHVGPAAGGYFVTFTTAGGYSTSMDGMTWTNPIALPSGHSIASLDWLLYDQGTYMASSMDGSLFVAPQISSPQQWQPFQENLPSSAFGKTGATNIYYDGSRYVAMLLGKNLIYTLDA